MADKSIIVHGNSVDDALCVASNLLKTPKNDLGYEVLRHGLVDHQGSVRISYQLTVVAPIKPQAVRNTKSAPTHAFNPPFSRDNLEDWSSDEFLLHLQTAVSSQPGIDQHAFKKCKSVSGRQLVLPSDLTDEDTPISHDGDVVVEGSVADGVSITATGSIKIYGDVCSAYLYAGEDIAVSGALLGFAQSTSGDIVCNSVQGAYIVAAGNVAIAANAYHSIIIGAHNITVGNSIVGGQCSAPEVIRAKITGSETGVFTRLFSGNNNRIREEAETVRQLVNEYIRQLSYATVDIKKFSIKEFAQVKGTVEERMKLWEAMSRKVWINDQLISLARRKTELLALIDQDRSAKIVICEAVHPQTHVEIDDVGMTVKKGTGRTTFTKDYETGVLRVSSIDSFPSLVNM